MQTTNMNPVNAEEVILDRRVRSAGTGPLVPQMPGQAAPVVPVLTRYSIRFHLKSGKHMDMHINEFDDWGDRNTLINAKKLLASVDSKLQEYGAWINNSRNDDPSQNFRVFDHALEAIEIVTR